MKTTGLIWIQSFYFEVNIFYNVRMYNVNTKYLFQIKAQDTMVWPENIAETRPEKRKPHRESIGIRVFGF